MNDGRQFAIGREVRGREDADGVSRTVRGADGALDIEGLGELQGFAILRGDGGLQHVVDAGERTFHRCWQVAGQEEAERKLMFA